MHGWTLADRVRAYVVLIWLYLSLVSTELTPIMLRWLHCQRDGIRRPPPSIYQLMRLSSHFRTLQSFSGCRLMVDLSLAPQWKHGQGAHHEYLPLHSMLRLHGKYKLGWDGKYSISMQYDGTVPLIKGLLNGVANLGLGFSTRASVYISRLFSGVLSRQRLSLSSLDWLPKMLATLLEPGFL